jgi:hypothetical protein
LSSYVGQEFLLATDWQTTPREPVASAAIFNLTGIYDNRD